MFDITERSECYCFRVRTEEPLKPKWRDILKFNVNVTNQRYTYYSSPSRRLMGPTILYGNLVPITCEGFIEHNHGFLRSVLWPSPEDIPECLDQLAQRIAFRVREHLNVQTNITCADDSDCREFHLHLDIFIVSVQHDEAIESDDEDDEEDENDEEDAVIEESMQEGVSMVPASKEAIESLKAFTDSSFLKTKKCNICMDKIQDDVKSLSLLSMPCNHVFHADCIVKWLQTSHMCPLCRYPMPIAKDQEP